MNFFLKLAFYVCTILNTSYVFAETPGIYCLDNNTGIWYDLAQNPTLTRYLNVNDRQAPPFTADGNDTFYALTSIFLQCRNMMADDASYTIKNTQITRTSTQARYSPAMIHPQSFIVAYIWKKSINNTYRPKDYEATTAQLPNRNNTSIIQISPSLVIYDGYLTSIAHGSYIGSVSFTLYKNLAEVSNQTITFRLYSTNTPVFQAETCTINNGQPLSVDLGTLDERDISSSSGLNSAVTKNIELNYSCSTKFSSNMKVQLVGEPASFSSTAVAARTGKTFGTGDRIANLGVEFYHKNIVLQPNSKNSFNTQITNGVGSDTLTIAPVKSTNANAINLPYGYFNASATLVFTSP